MIIPCIDLMGGQVVQLRQGREKALEADPVERMLERFAAFPEIQVIDLDAAMGRGSNGELVRYLAAHATCRVGGGVRSVDRARRLVEQGAHQVIVGTAAFGPGGPRLDFLRDLDDAIGRERLLIALDSMNGKIVVRGWREATNFTAAEVIHELEPYSGGFLCTYVDKEGLLAGTDLAWFRRLRAATDRPITAAGGISTYEEIRELTRLGVDAALGMAIYTGKLELAELAQWNSQA